VKSLRSRLQSPTDPEAGFTIIEIIVAMMIFAIIAVGVAASLTSSLVLTRDARSREVAANLAAQDIDVVRSTSDITKVLPLNPGDPGSTVVVDGLTYTITRDVKWVTSGGGDASCGTGDGSLQFKHINTRVTWAGRSAAVPAIQADTIVSPNGRITSPDTGTILVSVVGANGAGMSGVTVTIAPAAVNPNGAQTVDPAPAATDVQGCSYALKVAPGNYDITISSPSGAYVNENQQTTVTKASMPLIAGDTIEADFQYDKALQVDATFASNVGTSGIWFASNMKVDWAGENAIYQPTIAVPSSNKLVHFQLHPFANGYWAFTGDYVAAKMNPDGTAAPSCLSPDPGQWTANASGVVGRRTAQVTTITTSVSIPMGVVKASNLTISTPSTNRYLTAVVAPAANGDPGCSTTPAMTYKFTTKITTTSVNLALPFGTWMLFTGTSVGATTTAVTGANVSLPSGSVAPTSAGVFTLDPRVIAP
jgi:prepilin-type N-terminal cleavage/methylation domain-containing protein